MAKRKRLDVPNVANIAELETKSAISPAPRARMPIAEVAGEVAGHAALEEVAREMTAAEEEGRIVKRLPLDRIETQHLNRDRLNFDDEEMAVLRASMAERGQQTPVEVVGLPGGRFGLISGLRRILALREMGETEVLALIRKPESAGAAYVAMVEENEVRAALSFYERANVAVTATKAGVYPTVQRAVASLFAHAPSAKRSKILRFVVIRDKLHTVLAFPAAIPEKLGLALAKALEDDPALRTRLADALRKTPPADAAAERRAIERALKNPKVLKTTRKAETLAPGVTLTRQKDKAVLSGVGVDDTFLDALRDWALSRAKGSDLTG